ncbi:MAG: SDR family NAD(P)-dependent oxidoreductase [Betaproteobacteria bacterium]
MRLFAPLNPPIASFAGRRIWLVGASTGIGAATAGMLIAQGAIVAVSARSADKLQASFGGRAVVLPLDATDAAATHAAAEHLRALWGRIDLVLAVAGTYKEMRASELNLPEAQRIVEVNLAATLNVFAAVLPALLAQGAGGFGIVASVAGYGGLPNSVAYGASKAACINLAESLYLDLRKLGIAVYLITPGFVATPLTANNAFPMPFLVSAEKAAGSIVAGLARGDFEIHFPRAFTRLLKILNLLPYRLYFWCVRRFTGL